MIGRGAVVVFEGADRSGKTTHCMELSRTLQAVDVSNTVFTFPTRNQRSGITDIIDDIVRRRVHFDPPTQYMLFSAERFAMLRKMIDVVESGCTILIDRYVHSGIVYGCVSGLPRRFCMDKERGLLQPDLVILLDATHETFVMRPSGSNSFCESTGFQSVARSEYKNLADDDWLIISTEEGYESIRSAIFQRTLQVVEQVKTNPLRFF